MDGQIPFWPFYKPGEQSPEDRLWRVYRESGGVMEPTRYTRQVPLGHRFPPGLAKRHWFGPI